MKASSNWVRLTAWLLVLLLCACLLPIDRTAEAAEGETHRVAFECNYYGEYRGPALTYTEGTELQLPSADNVVNVHDKMEFTGWSLNNAVITAIPADYTVEPGAQIKIVATWKITADVFTSTYDGSWTNKAIEFQADNGFMINPSSYFDEGEKDLVIKQDVIYAPTTVEDRKSSVHVKIDRTAPDISCDAIDGWNTEAVDVTFTVTDALSGVAEVKVDDAVVEKNDANEYSFTANFPGETSYTITATDLAGNVKTQIVHAAYDPTEAILSMETQEEWTNAESVKVEVNLSEKPYSGVSGTWRRGSEEGELEFSGEHGECKASFFVTEEGSMDAEAEVETGAGKKYSAAAAVMIDRTKPVISAAASTQPNANGWYSTAPTIEVTASDTPAEGVTECSGVGKIEFTANVDLSGHWDELVLTDPKFTANREGVQTYTVRAADKANNSASTTVTIKLDSAVPKIKVTPSETTWTSGAVELTVKLTESMISGNAINGTYTYTKRDGSLGGGTFVLDEMGEATITIDEECNTDVCFTVTSNAGVSSEQAAAKVQIDRTAPVIDSITIDDEIFTMVGAVFTFNTIITPDSYLAIEAHDEWGELDHAELTITGERDGDAYPQTRSADFIMVQHVLTATFKVDTDITGTFCFTACDKANNSTASANKENIVAESSNAALTISTPIWRDSLEEYDGDPTKTAADYLVVTLSGQAYSGIKEYLWSSEEGGAFVPLTTLAENNGDPYFYSVTVAGESSDEFITTVPSVTITFCILKEAKTFYFKTISNAGHESSVQSVTVPADGIAPVVTLDWSETHTAESTGFAYYNAARTLTITVQEHNFDPESSTLSFTGMDQKTGDAITASTLNWQPVETRGPSDTLKTYRAEYTFGEGEYTDVAVNVTDLAGNSWTPQQIRQFIVDTTAPIISFVETTAVDDEPVPLGETNYYHAVRSYVIEVEDANFDPFAAAEGSMVNGKWQQLTASFLDGSTAPVEESWTKVEGKRNSYRCSLSFAEGRYMDGIRLQLYDYATNASNILEDKTPFIVDMTAPKIAISSVTSSHLAAFNGTETYFHALPSLGVTVTITDNVSGVGYGTVLSPAVRYTTANTDVFTETALTESDPQAKVDISISVAENALGKILANAWDWSGIQATQAETAQFTVDNTTPRCTVTFNDAYGEHDGKDYYGKTEGEITISVTIEEVFFDQSKIEQSLQLNNGGSGKLLYFTNDSNCHYAKITLTDDGDYRLFLKYVDFAGHALADYASNVKVLDTVAPTIRITGVSDRTAYAGDCTPIVTCFDRNMNEGALKILFSGKNRGELTPSGSYTSYSGTEAAHFGAVTGKVFTFDPFADTRENDDVYTLSASCTDYAGNTTDTSNTPATTQLSFSLNRNGSVFYYEKESEAINGTYINQEQTLLLHEINVTDIETTKILVTGSLNSSELTDGNGYAMEDRSEADGWKEYVYSIKDTNFTKEDSYQVVARSEDVTELIYESTDEGRGAELDAAGNVLAEDKGADMNFTVDKTAPLLMYIDLSDQSDENRSQGDSRMVQFRVKDDCKLEKIMLTINGETQIFTADSPEITGQSAREWELSFNLNESNNWQTINVSISDAAGNTSTLMQYKALVTNNVLVQYFYNKPLFYGSIAGVVVILAAAAWIVTARKKAKKAKA